MVFALPSLFPKGVLVNSGRLNCLCPCLMCFGFHGLCFLVRFHCFCVRMEPCVGCRVYRLFSCGCTSMLPVGDYEGESKRMCWWSVVGGRSKIYWSIRRWRSPSLLWPVHPEGWTCPTRSRHSGCCSCLLLHNRGEIQISICTNAIANISVLIYRFIYRTPNDRATPGVFLLGVRVVISGFEHLPFVNGFTFITTVTTNETWQSRLPYL